VAGFSFGDRSRHLSTLAASQPVRLVRQPENHADTHAIVVTTANGEELGYVPRPTAAALAPHLDEGLAHSAEIARVVPDAPSLDRAVYITLRALA
jgi:hypothetical protein